ncbi:hypothetical protein ACZ90_71105 [Streptomyces albus subsp. albus]|nr:hypothetical protein ACZ90_71105 [Streptomyces albus subsp. albus]
MTRDQRPAPDAGGSRRAPRDGLLRPGCQPDSYRTYDETAPEAVLRIRALLAAGLPTRIIHQVLPCTNAQSAVLRCPGVLDALHTQLCTLDQRSAETNAARVVLQQIITTADTATSLESHLYRMFLLELH